MVFIVQNVYMLFSDILLLQKISNECLVTSCFLHGGLVMRTLRLSFPEDLLKDIDLLVKIGRYPSRNDAIIKALNDFLNKEFINTYRRINYHPIFQE